MSKHIIIADTSPKRSDEMERLALWSAEKGKTVVTLFDANRHADRQDLSGEIVTHVAGLLTQKESVLVVANCVMGVRFGLLKALWDIKTPNHDLLKRVLLTCKKPDEVAAGFAERGLSIDWIEHVVWNAFDMSYHQDRMRAIFLDH